MTEKVHLRLRLIPDSEKFEFVFQDKTSEASLDEVRQWIEILKQKKDRVQLGNVTMEADLATRKRVVEYFEIVLESAEKFLNGR